MLDDVDRLTTPITFHFGDNDPFIPNEQVDAIKAATAGMNNVHVHVHEGAGHAFDNHLAPHFSQPDAAAEAWRQTTTELYARIGGVGRGA
jgi:carboxymethylenebutenolidase